MFSALFSSRSNRMENVVYFEKKSFYSALSVGHIEPGDNVYRYPTNTIRRTFVQRNLIADPIQRTVAVKSTIIYVFSDGLLHLRLF